MKKIKEISLVQNTIIKYICIHAKTKNAMLHNFYGTL